MHMQSFPVARCLVFLCVGVLSGIVCGWVVPLPDGLSVVSDIFLAPGLVFGLALLTLLGTHLLYRPQRTTGQIVFTLLSPLTAALAFALMIMAVLHGTRLLDSALFQTVMNLPPPENPNLARDVLAIIPLPLFLIWPILEAIWNTALALMALSEGLVSGVLVLSLVPLLRPKTWRVLVPVWLVIGGLMLPCMLMGRQFTAVPDQSVHAAHGLWSFAITPMFGPFFPLAFGLFAATLAWCLPTPTQKTI